MAALVSVCSGATDSDRLLFDALPLLRRLCGARSAVVLRRLADQQVVVAADGTPLPVTEIDGIGDVPVPAQWLPDITAATARLLPGTLGVMVLAWGTGDHIVSPDTAVAVVTSALARIVAEDALADLTIRVNSAQQLANMGDYDWHIASDTNRWSDQLYRIYGHDPQSFNASYERFLAHIYPDDRERIQAIHQQAYATGEPYQMIERIVRPDGEVRYLSSNGQVIQDESGTPLRMRGTCIDITDRVLAEQERERTAARFRSLVESSPDAILVHDKSGTVVQANGHATELLGGDPVGSAISAFLPMVTPAGQGVAAMRLDGQPLQLDVTTALLSHVDDDGLVAVFLRDATHRLSSEAMAATLREAQVRRRQALEINDNVVQGLTVAVNAVQQANTPAALTYLERTLTAARRMMNDWLDPLTGADLQPGDLVRATPSQLDDIPSAAPTNEQTRRVLLVDDYDDVRRLLRVQFERMGGYEVVGEAADGEEAVRLAAALQPDLVLLDLAMPIMDGLEALPLICDAVPGVRVIVLSGFDQGMMAQKVLAAGAVRYVEKGVRMNLSEILDGVLTA